MRRQHSTSALVMAYITATAALGVAFFALVLFFSSRASETSQIQQLGRTVGTVRSQNAQLARANASLTGQVNGLSSQLSGLLPLDVYTDRCQQYFTSPKGGPATYNLPCAPVQTGG